jgi:outer membrane protein TolC
MKIRIVIASLIISAVTFGQTLSFDEAYKIYSEKNSTVKNLKLTNQIREEERKELVNSLKTDLTITGSTSYNLDEETTEKTGKISYRDFYIEATQKDSTNTDQVIVGVEKTINNFIYNTDKAQIYSNKISNLNAQYEDKQSLMSSISSFGDKYVAVLNQDNTIKSTEILLQEKMKDLEIAKVKYNSQNLSVYDLKVIELSVNELTTTLNIAKVEKEDLLKEFKNLLNYESEITLKDLDIINDYEIYKDESSIKIIENQIELAKDELKGLKVANLPELTAGAYYDLDDEDTTMELGFTWVPLNYRGDEKSKKLTIEKYNNNLLEAQKSYELSIQQTQNSIKKLELNVELSKQTLDLAKLELEKYKIMKEKGTLSEYDYFDKQKEVLDDEIAYLNYLNQLNLAKKLQNIYSQL